MDCNFAVRSILQRACEGKKASDYFFTKDNGEWLDIHHFCQRRFKPLQRKIGVTKVIRFHGLRHTFASNFVMNDGSLFTLKKLLGHTKAEMTMRYAHLAPGYLQDAAKVVSYDIPS